MAAAESGSGGRYALMVATSEYRAAELDPLRSPGSDAASLAAVLRDPLIGRFDVQSLVNRQTHQVNEEIEGFFAGRDPDDLLVLYVAGHGIKDLDGRLRFATVNTRMDRLAATTVSADFLYEQVDRCRARKVLLLLDCCYSGAYLRGHKPRSSARADIAAPSGRGRAVLTSSTAFEYSFEVDTGRMAGESARSVFTEAIIEGLRTGQADRDQDGRVSLDDLYGYVYDRVRDATPHQTPELKWGEVRGEFILAMNPNFVPAPPNPLPAKLAEALENPYASVRAGAVPELAALAAGGSAGLARTVRLALERLASDDSRMVSAAAQAALADASEAGPAPRTEPPVRPPPRAAAAGLPGQNGKLGGSAGDRRAPTRSVPLRDFTAGMRRWLLAAYLLPVIGVAIIGVPAVALMLLIPGRIRLNAAQSLLVSVIGVPAYVLGFTAGHLAGLDPLDPTRLRLVLICSFIAGLSFILWLSMLVLCTVLVSRRWQPRLRGITRLACWLTRTRPDAIAGVGP